MGWRDLSTTEIDRTKTETHVVAAASHSLVVDSRDIYTENMNIKQDSYGPRNADCSVLFVYRYDICGTEGNKEIIVDIDPIHKVVRKYLYYFDWSSEQQQSPAVVVVLVIYLSYFSGDL